MSRRTVLIGVVVVAAAAAVAVPWVLTRSSGSVPLGMGYSSLTPLHCAVGEIFVATDILQQHGFDPSLIHFEHGKDQHESCSQGLIDATFSCEVPAMVHLDRLPGMVINGFAGELGDIALVVRQDSPIQGVEDLQGRNVALLGGSSSELVFEDWLSAVGLRRNADVRVDPHGGTGESAVDAVVAGRADAAVLWDPWLSKAEIEHDLRVVQRAPFWSLVATFEAHPSVRDPAAYMAAVRDALAYAAQHTDEVVALVSRRSGIPAPAVERVLRKNRFVSGSETPDLRMPEDVHQRLLACEAFARMSRRVPPEFRFADRLRSHP